MPFETKFFPATLIVPLYNKEERVKACLLSALGQTEPFVQIIVVNDGSTDASVSVVQALEASQSTRSLINQDNAGVSAARNTG